MTNKNEIFRRLPLFIVMAVVYLLIFSFSTSPFYSFTNYNDSNMFLIIGKGWSEGLLPYVDLWDSKGPIIFAINALGYIIAGSPLGVFILQCISLTVAFIFVYKTLILSFKPVTAMCLTAATLLVLGNSFDGGNSIDEWMLPWLMASTYFLTRWATARNSECHNPLWAFVYGLMFGVAMFMRIISIIAISGAIFVVIVVLIKNRKWKNLLACAGAFIGGVLIIALPFTLYFYSHGALGEMWYAMIEYNMEYASRGEVEMSAGKLLMIARAFINAWVMPLVLIFSYWQRPSRRRSTTMWLAGSILMLAWLMSSNLFQHYAVLCVPFFVLILVELKELDFTKVAFAYAVLLALVSTGYLVYNLRTVNNANRAKTARYTRILREPLSRGESIVAYDTGPDLYLFNGITPGMRFFVLQQVITRRGPSVIPLLKQEFADGKAQWALIFRFEGEVLHVDPELSSRYELVDTINIDNRGDMHFELYHVK